VHQQRQPQLIRGVAQASAGHNLCKMNLLFDLDGTLTDAASGITLCLQHALLRLGRQPPPVGYLRRFIGPPLRASFIQLLATDDSAVIESAVAHYQERFSAVGMYENGVYLDVPKGLAALREAGNLLWVVTSKPEVYARRIVEHFELSSLFQSVYGSTLSGEKSGKTDLG